MYELHGVTMTEYSEYREWLKGHGCDSWKELVQTYGETKAKRLYADYRTEQGQKRLF